MFEGWERWRGRVVARRASVREERAVEEKWRFGYAVRVDWADRSHSFTGWSRDYRKAESLLIRHHAYWRGAPISCRWRIVAANKDLVRRHRDPCDSPLCPSEEMPPPGERDQSLLSLVRSALW